MMNIFDVFLPPLFLMLIWFISDVVKKSHIKDLPYYKYYTTGLLVKLFGGSMVCLIYVYYYKGGDTQNYFYYGGEVLKKVFLKSPYDYLTVLLNSPSKETLFLFNSDTGYPAYWHDPNSFFVIKLMSVVSLFSFSSFIVGAMLLATICYSGVWRLYKVFVEFFPMLQKELAIAILFIPSVVFWGSGILKDTITLSALGWYLYSFYNLLIKKENPIRNIIALFIAAYLLISIKPYILFALMPGSLIWYLTNTVFKIKNFFIKAVVTPVLSILIIGGGYALLLSLGNSLGLYRVDKVLDQAVVVQRDLKQDYYKGNSFDIGDFDASVSSMIFKAPAAISAALFRPFIYEAKNPVMLLAGIENTFILLLTVYLLFKIKILNVFTFIRKNSLLSFSLLFSLFFAFCVGIATSNFGSLVRYKIPLLPFYVSSLFILKHFYEESIKVEETPASQTTYES